MDPFYQPFADAADIAAVKQRTEFEAKEHPFRLKSLEAQSMMDMGKAQEEADDRTAIVMATKAMKDAAAGAPDGKLDLAGNLEVGASALAQSGKLKLASTMLDKVEQARTRQERQQKLDLEQAKLDDGQKQQRLEWLQAALGEVKDQPSLDIAIQGYEAMTKERVPPAYKTYSPVLIEQLNRAVVSEKDRGVLDTRQKQLDLREQELREREARGRQAAATARIRAGIAQQRVDQAATREARLAKDGGGVKGKGAVVPPPAMRNHAEAVVKQMFPDLSKDQVKQYALDAASDAQVAMGRNPGVDMKSAVYGAVQQNADNIKSESRLFRKDKTTYAGAGSAEKTALPMPATVRELIPGKFYRDSKGVVKQYNPK